MPTLEEQRTEFIRQSGRFLAFPIAGAVVWFAIGIASLVLPPKGALYALLLGSGAIFPLALRIASLTGQQVFQKGNQFATLMGSSVLMVNLLWALHFLLLARLPALAPVSIAIALGIHWIVFGWIIQSSLGLVHAISRTVLCTAAYAVFKEQAIFAVSMSVVLCYALTIGQLLAHFRRLARAG